MPTGAGPARRHGRSGGAGSSGADGSIPSSATTAASAFATAAAAPARRAAPKPARGAPASLAAAAALCYILLCHAPLAAASDDLATLITIPGLHSAGRAWVEHVAQRLDGCGLVIKDARSVLEDSSTSMRQFNVTHTACTPAPTCQDPLVVVTTTDAKAEHLLPRFLQALAANNPNVCLHAIILVLGLSPEAISRQCFMLRFFAPSSSLRLSFVSLDKDTVGDVFSYGAQGSHGALGLPAATMARLLLPHLLPHVDRVLYLDLDLLVLGSLQDVFTGAACTPAFSGAVTEQQALCARTCLADNFKTWLSAPVRCACGYSKELTQFNAGVLLLSLNHMRAWGFTPFAIVLSRWLAANDQIILNLYANGTFSQLRPDHNMYYNFEARHVSKAVIAHATGHTKPWMPYSSWAATWRAFDPPIHNLVWASFTAPLPEWALLNLRTSAAAALWIHVHCATRACVDQVTQLGLAKVTVNHIHLSNLVTMDHPLSPWFLAHALMKAWYASDYPHLFDLTIRLAILYEGGVVTDIRSVLQQQLSLEMLTSAWCVTSGEAWVAAAPRRAPSLATALATLAQKLTTHETKSAWREHVTAFFTAYCGGGGAPATAAASSFSFNDGPMPPASTHFGALWFDVRTAYLDKKHNPGVNLGDEVQGLASLQWLPFADAHVERDDLALTKGSPLQPNASTTVFLNGWYGTPSMTWPPAPNINPIMVAIHLEHGVQRMFSTDESLAYLKQHAPIGARDTATFKFFKKHDVPTFLSYCMTLTLQKMHGSNCPVHDAVVVDVAEEAVAYLPASLNRTFVSPKYVDDGSGLKFQGDVRYRMAFELLQQSYGCTRVLITSRLHAALPALAMGVPVVLVLTSHLPGGGGHSDSRFSGLDRLVHTYDFTTDAGREGLKAFPWHMPPPNPGQKNLTAIRCKIFSHLRTHHSQLLDAVRVFDTDQIFAFGHQVCGH